MAELLPFKRKYFTAPCPRCRRETKMRLTGESAELGIVWLRCSGCHSSFSFSPEDLQKDGSVRTTSESHPQDSNGGDSPAEVVPYSPDKTFEIGQTIYHEAFHDYGRIVAKREAQGSKGKIVVEFQHVGEKVLIENYSPPVVG